MARGKTILPAVALLLLLCPCGLVNGTDVVENLFPTYPDDMEEQGRLSVISVSMPCIPLVYFFKHEVNFQVRE